jgi:hypothetical protein
MLIFHNHQMPQKAKSILAHYGEPVGFSAPALVYEAVSGHPDLFFVQVNNELVVSQNIPQKYLQLLKDKDLGYMHGKSPVGFKYPESARYNAVITENYFIHNLYISDSFLLEHFARRERIHVNQGYARCNLLVLADTHFLTSDEGIYKTLQTKGLQVLFVKPAEIELPGFSHGFFGGVCGIYQHTVFISGSLKHHTQGEIIRQFIDTAGYAIIELYDGPLFDGGSILFVA